MLRNKVVKSLSRAKADFFLTIIDKAKGNSKTIWNQLKKLTGDHPSKQKILEIKINGQLTNNSPVVAEAFNHYLIDYMANIAKCFTPDITNTCSADTTAPVFSLMNITETEVSQTIKSLRPSRAKDIFGIDAVMLKELCTSSTGPITKIINLSISQGMFPSMWKSAVVVPVFKSGDPHSMANYRPNSILPTVSKVAEELVAKQIIYHLN